MIVDLHQDISIKLLETGINNFLNPPKRSEGLTFYGKFGLVDQVDYPRLLDGKYKIILGASCALKLDHSGISVPKKPLEVLLTHINSYLELAKKSLGKIKLVKKNNDLNKPKKTQLGIILSVEGLYCLKGEKDFKMIDKLYKLGVRSIAPLWNINNNLGGGENADIGLTKLGKSLIKYLNYMNIIIDGSHSSPASLDDILKCSSRPIIVSHALSKTVFPSSRNLEDKHVKMICEKGGIIGVCFVGTFVGEAKVDALIPHIKHLAKIGSINNIAIGSDFGAMFKSDLIENLEDVSRIDNLEFALKKAGMRESEIEKIKWRNTLNFLKDNL